MKWDNLHVKDWVAIVEEVDDDESPSFDSFFSRPRHRHAHVTNGKPLRVVAMSFPFVCVTDGSKRYGLDFRKCHLRKLDAAYVRAMGAAKQLRRFEDDHVFVIEEPSALIEPEGLATTPGKRRRKKKADTRGCCPRCGTRMVELRIAVGAWVLRCKQCGFQGGNPSNQTGELPG